MCTRVSFLVLRHSNNEKNASPLIRIFPKYEQTMQSFLVKNRQKSLGLVYDPKTKRQSLFRIGADFLKTKQLCF